MTPIPIALGLTLCEKVIVEEGTRNVTLMSTFTKLRAWEFPSPPRQFDVYVVLTDGLGDGIIDLVGTRLETDERIYSLSMPVHFPDRRMEVRLRLRINGCSFPEPGRYQFTLLIDGEWIAHRELQVVAAEEKS